MATDHPANLARRRPAGLLLGMTAHRMDIDRHSRPIYVVDDDSSVRDSLSVLLETHGFDVLTHSSGGEMLADERRGDAGCLVVDQHMPGIDGLATLAALRSEGLAVPAILITGRHDAGIAARAATLGVIAVLEKPFPTPRLIELVRTSLGRSQ
jgi:FixJ family two-component response regulator